MKKKAIVLRINYFEYYDFAEEHNKIAKSDGQVWMLKLGRKISTHRLDALKDTDGMLVLRSDKKHGGKFFCTTLKDYYIGHPQPGMKYPKYYDELIDLYSYSREVSEEGTWLLVGLIEDMDDSAVDKLVLEKTGEPIKTLLERCSTSCMYAIERED